MLVSKEEREAYKRGQEEREAQRHPLSYLFARPAYKGETESEKAAFDKGLRGERLDQGKK